MNHFLMPINRKLELIGADQLLCELSRCLNNALHRNIENIETSCRMRSQHRIFVTVNTITHLTEGR